MFLYEFSGGIIFELKVGFIALAVENNAIMLAVFCGF
jgi:hypothetical protein